MCNINKSVEFQSNTDKENLEKKLIERFLEFLETANEFIPDREIKNKLLRDLDLENIGEILGIIDFKKKFVNKLVLEQKIDFLKENCDISINELLDKCLELELTEEDIMKIIKVIKRSEFDTYWLDKKIIERLLNKLQIKENIDFFIKWLDISATISNFQVSLFVVVLKFYNTSEIDFDRKYLIEELKKALKNNIGNISIKNLNEINEVISSFEITKQLEESTLSIAKNRYEKLKEDLNNKRFYRIEEEALEYLKYLHYITKKSVINKKEIVSFLINQFSSFTRFSKEFLKIDLIMLNDNEVLKIFNEIFEFWINFNTENFEFKKRSEFRNSKIIMSFYIVNRIHFSDIITKNVELDCFYLFVTNPKFLSKSSMCTNLKIFGKAIAFKEICKEQKIVHEFFKSRYSDYDIIKKIINNFNDTKYKKEVITYLKWVESYPSKTLSLLQEELDKL